MDVRNKLKDAADLAFRVFVIVFALSYGVASAACIYIILPSNIPFFFTVIWYLLALASAFIPFGLLMEITSDKPIIPHETCVVLFSLFAIPILIWACYCFKLDKVEKNNYRIAGEDKVRYEVDAKCFAVNDHVPGNKWEAYLTDWNDNTFSKGEVYEVSKYDIIPLIINVRSSHPIEDSDINVTQKEDNTVRRQVVFSFVNDVGKGYEHEGDITVYDPDHNEINVHLITSIKRKDDAWYILNAKVADEKDITIFNALGQKCPNLDKYTQTLDDGTYDGNGFYTCGNDYRKYAVISDFMGSEVYYEYLIGGRSEIICVGYTTLPEFTQSEANTLFDKTLDYTKAKYGSSDDDMFTNHEYYMHESGDIVTLIQEEQDGEMFSLDYCTFYPDMLDTMKGNDSEEF